DARPLHEPRLVVDRHNGRPRPGDRIRLRPDRASLAQERALAEGKSRQVRAPEYEADLPVLRPLWLPLHTDQDVLAGVAALRWVSRHLGLLHLALRARLMGPPVRLQRARPIAAARRGSGGIARRVQAEEPVPERREPRPSDPSERP